MPSTNPNWLDGRLEHTLKRGREWITSSKPNVAELKDKATAAMADLLAAQQEQKGKVPVVRLPNGDYIWGRPYQAAGINVSIPQEVLDRQRQQQLIAEENARRQRGLLGSSLGGHGFQAW